MSKSKAEYQKLCVERGIKFTQRNTVRELEALIITHDERIGVELRADDLPPGHDGNPNDVDARGDSGGPLIAPIDVSHPRAAKWMTKDDILAPKPIDTDERIDLPVIASHVLAWQTFALDRIETAMLSATRRQRDLWHCRVAEFHASADPIKAAAMIINHYRLLPVRLTPEARRRAEEKRRGWSQARDATKFGKA